MEYLAFLQPYLTADYGHKALELVGAGTVFWQSVPRLLAWGVPAAASAADYVARLGLNSPLKPLILWKAPQIIAFLKSLTCALNKITDTFSSRLEADLAKASAASSTPSQS